MSENNNGKNGKNAKQDLAIISIQKDIERLTGEMSEIKKQVTNDIPHQIAQLDKKINEDIGGIKDRIFYGGIIGLGSVVIVQILLKFF